MNQFKDYTIAKVLATLLVVGAHVTIMFTPQGAIPMPHRVWARDLTNIIYAFHMPAFVFLSGALYMHGRLHGKYRHYGAFLKMKALRLLLPFLFFGLFFVTPVMTGLGITKLSPLQYFLRGILLMEDTRHLWYLPALFLIFAAVNGAACLGRYFKLSGTTSYIALLASLVISLPLHVLAAREKIPHIFRLHSAAWYLVFFLAGCLLAILREAARKNLPPFRANQSAGNAQEKDMQPSTGNVPEKDVQISSRSTQEKGMLISALLTGKFRITGVIASLLIFFLTTAIYLRSMRIRYRFLLAFAGIFLILQLSAVLAEKTALSEHVLFKILARDSFGIYLIHPMLNYLFFAVCGGIGVPASVFCVFAFSLSLAGSILITELLRRTRLEVVIGE